MSGIVTWAHTQPYLIPAVAVVVVLLVAAAAWSTVRAIRTAERPPAAVLVASLAAVACTAYSGDTSWGFAADHLGMVSVVERGAMFFAAELALFSTALMARQNLKTTGAPGLPGVLVWVITGVQVIPAYAESGLIGGTVRAFVGPVLAAMLWHLAMGIELRHAKPGAASGSMSALLAREARERLLSRLGLAVRDRSAEQISRDRWTVKAVGLAAKLADMAPGARGRSRVARRLSVAVGRAQAGAAPEQRQMLLDLLAARRHAAALATIDLPSPWQPEPEPVVAVEAPRAAAVPEVVPAGAACLPIVAADMTTEVTIERAAPEPEQVVIRRAIENGWNMRNWSSLGTAGDHRRPAELTGSVAATVPRQVVTVPVTITPAELRRQARKLNREVVTATNRPVTIERLREEYGLSRRDATELRRDVVGSGRS